MKTAERYMLLLLYIERAEKSNDWSDVIDLARSIRSETENTLLNALAVLADENNSADYPAMLRERIELFTPLRKNIED